MYNFNLSVENYLNLNKQLEKIINYTLQFYIDNKRQDNKKENKVDFDKFLFRQKILNFK